MLVEPRVVEEAPTVVLKNATILPVVGEVIESGSVVMQDHKIIAVSAGEVDVPDGAVVLDLKGKFITPGLIDVHSHLGAFSAPHGQTLQDGNEATDPLTPGVWIEHSITTQDPGFQDAIAGGVTALQILPGSANLVGGRGFVVEVVPRRGGRAMQFPGAAQTVKMACGENPMRAYGGRKQAPSTRMGNVRALRIAFDKAKEYQRKIEEYEKKLTDWEGEQSKKKKKRDDSSPPKPPARNLDQETLVGIMKGEILPQWHCYRADDMLSMLQVAEEFGFSAHSFHHALEAYKIRDILAEHNVAAVTWPDWWGFKVEAYDGILENVAFLHESGVRAILHSDSHTTIQRLNQEAAKAYYAGLAAGVKLSENDALSWVTLNSAWALGIDDVTGSLEPGKRADIVVWDKHPFSVYAKAELVFVDGLLRHNANGEQAIWSDFELGQGVLP
ncbi:MAG: amidohydrolase [Proteobacteria bacterium]|nr:amidohydrolase [Pseudomonadota bacterium]